METKDLQGKMVAVLGYGMEGRAVAAYLKKHGIKPVLFDQKPLEEWPQGQRDEIINSGFGHIFGPDCFKELAGFEVAFRSPGIKPANINLKGYEAKGLAITSQTKWFFGHSPAKIIGVTGTKGKGTTSALIYEMLNSQPITHNSKTYLTGNIGKTQPFEILDDLKADDWVVYELSSFQLQDLTQSPHVGVVLMITSEHLDYHTDVNEYTTAKEAIAKFQKADDFAIINADFEASVKIGNLGNGKKILFSRQKTSGIECFVKDGQIVIAGSGLQLPVSGLQLKGAHNLENVCAAILAARAAGVYDEAIIKTAVNFKGLEHRLEFVAEKNGIKFYNDSFSTTPETAVAAIKSFTEPLVVILGGSSKNSDFSELGKAISEAKNITTLIIVGQETDKIRAALAHEKKFNGTLLTGAKNMGDIFWQIKLAAKPGDTVLLSPACASFGMFKDYKDRGEQFKQMVSRY